MHQPRHFIAGHAGLTSLSLILFTICEASYVFNTHRTAVIQLYGGWSSDFGVSPHPSGIDSCDRSSTGLLIFSVENMIVICASRFLSKMLSYCVFRAV